MERVRLTIRPDGVDVHPVYRLLAGGAPYLSTAELVNANVRGGTPALLVRVEGDAEAFAADVESIPAVVEHELVPVSDREAYVYMRDEGSPVSLALFETFTRGSVIGVPPVTYNDDGSATLTVVGPVDDVTAAVEGVPDGIRTDVEAVGSPDVAPETVVSRLSPRQREAVETAVAVGYYDVPRRATHEAVADAMGCAPSTASEHLRKAEATLVTALVG